MSMPILPDAVTPPAPEVAIVNRLQRQNEQLLDILVRDWRAMVARLWRDPNTGAQTIFDAFDADGAALLATITARKDCIEAIAVAAGQTLDDYLTPGEVAAIPAYTVSGGVVTVT